MAKNKNKNQIKKKVPKTVQDTIPYTGVYKNGIIETTEGHFTKSYQLKDINFKTASEENTEKILKTFGELLNTFDDTMIVQFTINNHYVDRKKFEKNILSKMHGDELDELREENNQILRDKLKEGHSNTQHDKYMTISLEAESIDEAFARFSRIDSEISTTIKKITGEETEPMSLMERLELLYNLMNRDDEN